MTVRILVGDARERLRDLPDASVHCVVTSPPYWGLRDYGVEGQIGLERIFVEYTETMVAIFRDVRRVLRRDGTLWLNLGDCYATGAGKVGECPGGGEQGARWAGRPALGSTSQFADRKVAGIGPMTQANRLPQPGLKPKDLIGIPWRVAFALQADGWWLRQALPWVKRNPMPESTKDRPTTAVEYVFQLTRGESYFYDYDAVMRPASLHTNGRLARNGTAKGSTRANGGTRAERPMKALRGRSTYGRHTLGDATPPDERRKLAEPGSGVKNNSSMDEALAVMPERRAFRQSDLFLDSFGPLDAITDDDGQMIALDVLTHGFSEAHFATFPPKLIEPLIKASCPKGGTVLDPFFGAGTTGLVADRLGRNCIGIELNPEYAEMTRRRVQRDAPLFAEVPAE